MTTVLSHLMAAASASPVVSPLVTPALSPVPTLIPSAPIPTLAPVTPALGTPQLPALLLSGIVWIPLIVALALLLVPQRTEAERARVRLGAIIGSGFVLILALLMYYSFADQGGTLAFEERRSWLPGLGASYHLGVDGVSMVLLLLSSLLSFLAILASNRVRERTRAYFALMLLLETGLNGVFASLDYLLLLMFWSMPLVLVFFLCVGWGGLGRVRAAWKALTFGLTSTALLTLAVLIMAKRGVPATLDLVTLHQTVQRGSLSGLVFWLVFAACAILLPMWPLHTWFLDVVSEASAPVAALIGGALPALGGYGLYRTVLGQFGAQLHQVRGAILILALITLVWSGVGALQQDDLKRVIAYFVMSRAALVLLAVVSATPVALNGGVVLLFATGLGSALLVLTVGMVADRTGTRSIRALAGLAARLPRAAVLFLLGGLGVMGLPGLAGFIGMVLIFLGAYPVHRTAVTVAIIASVLISGIMIWTTERIFFGPPAEGFLRLRDLSTLELTYGVALAALIVVLGIFPSLLVNNINFGILSLLAGASG